MSGQIPEGYEIKGTPSEIPDAYAANTNKISDYLIESTEYDFHRIRDIQTGNPTSQPQKFLAIRNEARKYLVSDDGTEIYDTQGYHGVTRVLRDFNGEQIYVGRLGSTLYIMDGSGNILYDGKTNYLKYDGNGVFKTKKLLTIDLKNSI